MSKDKRLDAGSLIQLIYAIMNENSALSREPNYWDDNVEDWIYELDARGIKFIVVPKE